jgi:catechol 2,3-dioxygenase-like lactoylglutathione lyase family enzyme
VPASESILSFALLKEQLMKIGFVRVFVSDFDRAYDFYTSKLGFPSDYTDNTYWAQFHAGEDISLAIEKCDPDHIECGSKLVGRYVGTTLMVDDINKTYEALTAKGVEFLSEPEKQPWGGILTTFKDPDGNVFTLMESSED